MGGPTAVAEPEEENLFAKLRPKEGDMTAEQVVRMRNTSSDFSSVADMLQMFGPLGELFKMLFGMMGLKNDEDKQAKVDAFNNFQTALDELANSDDFKGKTPSEKRAALSEKLTEFANNDALGLSSADKQTFLAEAEAVVDTVDFAQPDWEKFTDGLHAEMIEIERANDPKNPKADGSSAAPAQDPHERLAQIVDGFPTEPTVTGGDQTYKQAGDAAGYRQHIVQEISQNLGGLGVGPNAHAFIKDVKDYLGSLTDEQLFDPDTLKSGLKNELSCLVEEHQFADKPFGFDGLSEPFYESKQVEVCADGDFMKSLEGRMLKTSNFNANGVEKYAAGRGDVGDFTEGGDYANVSLVLEEIAPEQYEPTGHIIITNPNGDKAMIPMEELKGALTPQITMAAGVEPDPSQFEGGVVPERELDLAVPPSTPSLGGI